VNTKVSDLMAKTVVTAYPNDSVADALAKMESEGIHAVPIVDGEDKLVGIVSTADLAQVADGTTPLRKVMSHHPHTIPEYNDISAAARLMRNRHVHHVLVTHEQKLVGILSSFDLLKLVEDKRFTMKSAPTGKKRRP
jgi:CBS domain-containing protein